MDQTTHEKLKTTQLEIMDEIHRLCLENNIVYYLIGGTALGAARHRGFIPWDIDIDIAMPRDDYDRFKIVCQSSLKQDFAYYDYTLVHNFDHPHALLCKKNTRIEWRTDKFNRPRRDLGIYVDIFPLDNAPSQDKLKRKQIKQINRIRKIQKYKFRKCYSSSKIKKTVKWIRSLPYIFISIDRLNMLLDKEMRRYNESDTGFLCSMSSHYSYDKQYMEKEIYGTAQLVEYEKRKYFAPQKLDEYLQRIYGNYMELPPVEKQTGYLDAIECIVWGEFDGDVVCQ